MWTSAKWRGAGVAERAALEMPYARERIEGSNPSLSARWKLRIYSRFPMVGGD